MTHSSIVTKRINSSADFHTKSWSYRHECPTCGKTRRYNSNFLGSRFDLVCDGSKIVRHRRGEPFERAIVVGSTRGAVDTTCTEWVKDEATELTERTSQDAEPEEDEENE